MIRGRFGRDHILAAGNGLSGREKRSQDICVQRESRENWLGRGILIIIESQLPVAKLPVSCLVRLRPMYLKSHW